MVKKTSKKSIEKSASKKYKLVADNFYNGAEVAKEFEYWNASGVLIVHAAIAYSDAICIKYGGVKNQSNDHYQIIALMNEIVADSSEKKSALKQLERIIEHKNAVSYSGDIYTKGDIELLWKYIVRFKNPAEKLFISIAIHSK